MLRPVESPPRGALQGFAKIVTGKRTPPPTGVFCFSMRRLPILILILTALVIGTAVFTVRFEKTETEIPRPDLVIRTEQQVRTVLEVPGLSYEVFVSEGSTAYDLMVSVASQHNDFSFKGREFSGLGFFVEEINGLSQDQKEGRYWIYYINSQSAPVGVSQYKVKENDVITWKYETEH